MQSNVVSLVEENRRLNKADAEILIKSIILTGLL